MTAAMTLHGALRIACEKVGIVFREVPMDGCWHSTDIEGDRRGRGDGRIKLFQDGEGGIVVNWKGDITSFFIDDDARTVTDAERQERERRRAEAMRQAAEEDKRRRAAAAEKAMQLWNASRLAAADHPYLTRKQVTPVDTLREMDAQEAADILGYRPKARGETLTGRLLVALLKVGDKVSTAELIDENGRKSAIAGGAKGGGYWAAQRLPEGDGAGLMLLIGEGVATVLTACAATGHAGIAALSCNNLLFVARAMRERYPRAALVILADIGNGQRHAEEAAGKTGGRLAVPDFGRDRPEFATDFNDLAQHCGIDAVKRAIVDTSGPAPDGAPQLHVVNVAELLELKIPPREFIMEPLIQTQGTAMLYSKRGVGKTYLSLALGCAVAAGSSLLRWRAPKPRKVLYVDGEMPAVAMQERLAAIIAGLETEFDPSFFRLVTPDLQEHGIPSLSGAAGQTLIEDHLDGTELLILDNISTLCRGGKENEAESWLPMQEWVLSLRRRGISTLLDHHAGKDGAQRGTSRREDVLDTVITLKHPAEYDPTQGARFEVHFEKARNTQGASVEPFEVTMTVQKGAAVWLIRDIEDVQASRARELFAEGLSVRDVGEELKISKSKAQRLKSKTGGAI